MATSIFGILSLFFFVALIVLYFVPSIIAFRRRHRNRWAIFALNLVLGWSFLGWVASLIWACVAGGDLTPKVKIDLRTEAVPPPAPSQATTSNEEVLLMLTRLKEVYERGGIDKDEYHRLRDPIIDRFLSQKAA
ncbi:superinfection immunity protein [Devosia sediminis]|uniref:Superinfection immunity protein n=1 Tax=Devosia sediminis TaxID=2798801 RepID=A0A934ITL2_9HYPH|nr:superinfection immunity protein [Devosia sediminis]MBJ3784102.1 superinfection immunity protein [Devosia sediminis]